MQALANSIRQHGVIQPIAVRTHGSTFQIIAGERRVIAARAAGLTTVPALIRELSDDEMLLVALVENLQRQDLNPVERARALKQLIEQHGKSHEEVAELAGLARSTVTNSIRLLDLDDDSIAALKEGRITEGHARSLLAESKIENRRQLLRKIEDNNLNVRQTEVEVYLRRDKGSAKPSGPSADAHRLGKLLTEHLKTRVEIVERGLRGRIVIRYGSLKDFERLFEAITGTRPPDE